MVEEAFDTGCELADKCLTCPLPWCVEEATTKEAAQAYRRGMRDIMLLKAFEELESQVSHKRAVVSLALSELIQPRSLRRRLDNGLAWRQSVGWDGRVLKED